MHMTIRDLAEMMADMIYGDAGYRNGDVSDDAPLVDELEVELERLYDEYKALV